MRMRCRGFRNARSFSISISARPIFAIGSTATSTSSLSCTTRRLPSSVCTRTKDLSGNFQSMFAGRKDRRESAAPVHKRPLFLNHFRFAFGVHTEEAEPDVLLQQRGRTADGQPRTRHKQGLFVRIVVSHKANGIFQSEQINE